MKRIVALMLGLLMTIATVGCGKGGFGGVRSDVELDENRTTLVVANWNGGVGDEWLTTAIEKFEKKYADYSFEKGKKGVQVILGSNNKTTVGGESLKELIGTEGCNDDIFFTENVYYQWWAKTGKMLDITDYVNEPLKEFGEDESIVDKMNDDILSSMSVDGKIYALPFWVGTYCMVYNATLFDEEEWYIAEDGSYTNASGKLGNGPDGQAGTYDDGMPATYEEFFALLDQIKKDNSTPILWPGASQDYLMWLIAELAADNMGYDQFMMNYTFSGEAELAKLDSVNYDTMEFETEKVTITEENGYELGRQPGLLRAVKFAERLVQDTSLYDANKCMSGSYKIAQSQLDFVRNTTMSSQKDVAILVEGTWWENEATAAFKETYGSSATKYDAEMDYKVMPLPKATKEYVGTENIMVSPLDSFCFIKSDIAEERKEAAVKFLQFVHTDAQMTEFTKMTGLTKPFEYKVDEEGLTSFAKSILETTENSRIVYPMSDNKVYTYSPSTFRLAILLRSAYNPDIGYRDNIVTALAEMKNGEYVYSTEDYMKGIYDYRKNTLWKTFDSILK